MPQPSVYYACGRVGVLSGNALHTAQLERLMATHTYEEASRTLVDIGFVQSDASDFQAAADAHVKKACMLLEQITPKPKVTGCFQLRYDIHNLKVLLKSRFLAQKPQFLSQCGVFKPEALSHAVTEHRYGQLPAPLKDALDGLEKELVRRFDPMLIDSELDKAMYRLIFDWLKEEPSPRAKRYFTAKVDLQNYIMLLRAKAMGKDAAFFGKLFLPCGSLSLPGFQKAFADPERLAKLLKPYGEKIWRVGMECALNAGKLPLMEKTVDDYLYELFNVARYQTASLDTLIAYLLRVQREATDVRLIMAAKLNGFTQADLEERVRELHD